MAEALPARVDAAEEHQPISQAQSLACLTDSEIRAVEVHEGSEASMAADPAGNPSRRLHTDTWQYILQLNVFSNAAERIQLRQLVSQTHAKVTPLNSTRTLLCTVVFGLCMVTIYFVPTIRHYLQHTPLVFSSRDLRQGSYAKISGQIGGWALTTSSMWDNRSVDQRKYINVSVYHATFREKYDKAPVMTEISTTVECDFVLVSQCTFTPVPGAWEKLEAVRSTTTAYFASYSSIIWVLKLCEDKNTCAPQAEMNDFWNKGVQAKLRWQSLAPDWRQSRLRRDNEAQEYGLPIQPPAPILYENSSSPHNTWVRPFQRTALYFRFQEAQIQDANMRHEFLGETVTFSWLLYDHVENMPWYCCISQPNEEWCRNAVQDFSVQLDPDYVQIYDVTFPTVTAGLAKLGGGAAFLLASFSLFLRKFEQVWRDRKAKQFSAHEECAVDEERTPMKSTRSKSQTPTPRDEDRANESPDSVHL
eukprot:TRINITY_DN12399_c0_g3_i1.p1 TRINITY_DN12399_c0_g3~~TRINITY_DN12399_c0_g3_i1.p1  ORF type:complete len:475 (-),score=66.88 TRINITY_DN12399_c0_g3_i1:409-1833(-)